jgi:hypothetical protein
MLKVKNILFVLVLLCGYSAKVSSQDLSQMQTLFTTAKERQIIDSNRYKEDKPVENIQPQVEPEQQNVDAEREVKKEEVVLTYKISGVSTNNEGSKTAWVNGQAYESGEVMDDGSKIRIKNSSVVITAPDGKNYSAVSGELLDISYQRVIQE